MKFNRKVLHLAFFVMKICSGLEHFQVVDDVDHDRNILSLIRCSGDTSCMSFLSLSAIE